MKIGLVSSYMPPHLGGIEQIAENLFEGYRRRGCEVRWVSSRVPSSPTPHDDGRVRVPCLNLVEDLLGIPVPLWGPTGWAEVRRLAEWADALHVVECLYIPCAMAVAAAGRAGKPVLLSQNVGFVRYRLPLFNWMEQAAYATLGRSVLRRCSHLILATPAAEAYVDSLLGKRRPRSSVFPIGIDTDRFRPGAPGQRRAARNRLDLPPDAPIVLFAGRLVEKKGLSTVLDVSRRLPEIGFLVVGDGPLRHLLRALPGNVSWRQHVSADRMGEHYQAADCVLLPSHGEGLPLVVQEAMASGRPVVISDDEPYAAALMAAGVCAAAPRTGEAMAARVLEVLSGGMPGLAERARAYAMAHWSVDTMVDRCLALLADLAGAGSRGAPAAGPR
jgi:glycosyltransferase involved in cell wall biosynthesis